jgi:hypothetical protein
MTMMNRFPGIASSSLGYHLGTFRGPESREGNTRMSRLDVQEATVGLVPRLHLGMLRDSSASLRSAARPALDPGEVPPLVLMDSGA